jgi:hypothetical protein
MTPTSLINDDWNRAIGRVGGADLLASGARTTKAFAWSRKIADPVTLLRLVLAYCLGQWGPAFHHRLGRRCRLRRHFQRRSALPAAPMR